MMANSISPLAIAGVDPPPRIVARVVKLRIPLMAYVLEVLCQKMMFVLAYSKWTPSFIVLHL